MDVHEIIKDKIAKIIFFKDNTSIQINYIINIKKFLDDNHIFYLIKYIFVLRLKKDLSKLKGLYY